MRDEEQRLLHALEFWADPFDTSVPIPRWAHDDAEEAFCTCKTPPEAYHADWCGFYGIYAEVCDDLVVYPRSHMRPRSDDLMDPMGWRWVCSGDDSQPDNWHVGGLVNGPAHWCTRERRWVDAS